MITFEELKAVQKIHRLVKIYELLHHINDTLPKLATLLEDQLFSQAIAKILSDNPIGQLQRYFDDNILIDEISEDDIISILRITSNMIVTFFYNIDSVAKNIPLTLDVDLNIEKNPYSLSPKCASNKFGVNTSLVKQCQGLCKRFNSYLSYLHNEMKCIDTGMAIKYRNFIDILHRLLAEFPSAWQQIFFIEHIYRTKAFQPSWFYLSDDIVHFLIHMIKYFNFPEFINPMLNDERLPSFLLAAHHVYESCNRGAMRPMYKKTITALMDTNVANPERFGQLIVLLIEITSQFRNYFLENLWFHDGKVKADKISAYDKETEKCFTEVFRIKDQENQLDTWMSILKLVKNYSKVINTAREETPFHNRTIKNEQPKFYAEVQALIDSTKIKHFPYTIDFQRDCFPLMLTSSNPVAAVKSLLFLNTLHRSLIKDRLQQSTIKRYTKEILSYSEPWQIIKILLLIDQISNYDDNDLLFKNFLNNNATLNSCLESIATETLEKQDDIIKEIAKSVYTQWIEQTESFSIVHSVGNSDASSSSNSPNPVNFKIKDVLLYKFMSSPAQDRIEGASSCVVTQDSPNEGVESIKLNYLDRKI